MVARVVLFAVVLLGSAQRARPAAGDPPACAIGRLPPDAGSSACLSCHGGSGGAPDAHPARCHPYDVAYRAGPRGRGALRPIADVEQWLRLPGGQVTCTTCHDGSSTLEHYLARPLTGEPWQARLCNVCHAIGS